jgi:hypothetical protein
MPVARHCRNRAKLLLQIAEKCPQFKAQAVFIAYEWFIVAAVVDQITKPKLNKSPHQLEEERSILTKIEQARR